jgi:BASS family bile acid:Na+ symporter
VTPREPAIVAPVLRPLARLLTLFAERATLFLPMALLLGLLLQDLAAALKPFVTPMVIVLLGIAMARTDWPAFAAVLRRPWLGLAMVFAAMIGVPLIAAPLLRLMPIADGLALALALMACLPPLTSMAAMAGFLHLDRAHALFAVLIGTALGPLTIPPLALALFSLDLKIGFWAFMGRLTAIVVAGFVLALVLRSLSRGREANAAPLIDGVLIVTLLVFAIPIMDGVTARILAEPWRTGGFVLWSFIATFAYMTMATLVFWPLVGLRLACTAGYAAGSRNNALLLAALPATVDPDYFLFIAAVQFPIYLIPTITQPIYRRLLPHGR